MIKVLVVETTKCGYDGITNVIKNYFLYQEDPEIQMDLVTINEAVPELKTFLEQKGRRNYQLPYRNRNPLKYVMKLRKILKERRVSDYPCTWMQWNDGSRNAGGKISRD